MDSRSNVEAGQPSIRRPIVEHTNKGSIMWQRAGKRGAQWNKHTRKPNSFAKGSCLKLKSGQIRCVEGENESTKIALTEHGRIETVNRFVINSFRYSPSEI